MHKAVDFSTYKKIQKFTLNEINRWVETIYKDGFDAGYKVIQEKSCKQFQIEPSDLVSAYTDERLLEILLSVHGINQTQAQEVVDKILAEGVDPTLWD